MSVKQYKRGDVVTFRLVKKLKYSNEVITLINEGQGDKNARIIKAIEFYVKYKHLEPIMTQINNELINRAVNNKQEIKVNDIINIKVDEAINLSKNEQNNIINIHDTVKAKHTAEDEIFGEQLGTTNDEKPQKTKPVSRLLASIKRN